MVVYLSESRWYNLITDDHKQSQIFKTITDDHRTITTITDNYKQSQIKLLITNLKRGSNG